MPSYRGTVACAAVFLAVLARPALAGGAETKPMSCQVLQQECMERVERAQRYAADHNTDTDPNFSDVVVCYRAGEQARNTGRWPKLGPMLPRGCSASDG